MTGTKSIYGNTDQVATERYSGYANPSSERGRPRRTTAIAISVEMVLEDPLCQPKLKKILIVLTFIKEFDLLFGSPEFLVRVRGCRQAIL